FANGDRAQLEVTTKFLKENSVTVDIFGLIELPAGQSAGTAGKAAPSPASGVRAVPPPGGSLPAGAQPPVVSSLFAGEEGVSGAVGTAGPRAGAALVGPLPSRPDGDTGLSLQRGREYLIE